MISSKTKTIVIVFALLLFTGIATVGCGQKPKTAWVNTNSMPGNTFVKHRQSSNAAKATSTIVYLGSSSSKSKANFGPGEVNFEFQSLK